MKLQILERVWAVILNDCFFPIIIDQTKEELWFQQKGAMYQSTNEPKALLQEQFGEKVISKNGPLN